MLKLVMVILTIVSIGSPGFASTQNSLAEELNVPTEVVTAIALTEVVGWGRFVGSLRVFRTTPNQSSESVLRDVVNLTSDERWGYWSDCTENDESLLTSRQRSLIEQCSLKVFAESDQTPGGFLNYLKRTRDAAQEISEEPIRLRRAISEIERFVLDQIQSPAFIELSNTLRIETSEFRNSVIYDPDTGVMVVASYAWLE